VAAEASVAVDEAVAVAAVAGAAVAVGGGDPSYDDW
jgi:hypothetical protein